MEILKIIQNSGADDAGFCSLSSLRPFMTNSGLRRSEAKCPGAKCVIMCVFSYYVNPSPGNLSVYCRGEDYHTVIIRRLESACRSLTEIYPKNTFCPFADNSPIPEKPAAVMAGLGVIGQNQLFISNKYGSFVFLGDILTDLEMPVKCVQGGECLKCGRCEAACPTGALKDGHFDKSLCISFITQKKGPLTPSEEEILCESPTIWGCDLCQLCCPMNTGLPETPIPEFRGTDDTPYISSVNEEYFKTDEFKKRAFAWKGREILIRNIKLSEE